MSHNIAQNLTKETGFEVKYNPSRHKYVIYPMGIECSKPRQVKYICRDLSEMIFV